MKEVTDCGLNHSRPPPKSAKPKKIGTFVFLYSVCDAHDIGLLVHIPTPWRNPIYQEQMKVEYQSRTGSDNACHLGPVCGADSWRQHREPDRHQSVYWHPDQVETWYHHVRIGPIGKPSENGRNINRICHPALFHYVSPFYWFWDTKTTPEAILNQMAVICDQED
jgi:hypothetical protein